MKTTKPKTINEAIDELNIFLECDLYSLLRPEYKMNGEIWKRTDTLKSEKEFIEYLDAHFKLLKKQIKRINLHPRCKGDNKK